MNALGSIKSNKRMWEIFGGKEETSFGGILDSIIGLLLQGLFRGNVTFANSAGSWNPQRSQFLLTMLMVIFFFTCLLNASNQPI